MKTLTLLLPVLFALAMLSTQTVCAQSGKSNTPIDRHALVTRHNVVLTKFDGERPLQVGNGEFAFGMDITGLQTFAPFNTMSQWGWHSSPLLPGQHPDDFAGQVWDTHGRPVRYPMPDPQRPELSAWLAANPHRLNLGRIGLVLAKKDGTPAAQGDLRNARQQLDLWNGLVTSRFELEGEPITVTTACHPTLDATAVRVVSPLVHAGRLAVFLECPGNDPRQFANFVGDWNHPGRFTLHSPVQKGRADFERRIDATRYHVSLAWKENAELRLLPTDTTVPPVLRIVKAEYGAGDKWLDVTDIAAKAVHEGHLTLRANNALGADPAPGIGKTLRVVYMLGRNGQTAEVRENEELRLDSASAQNRITLQPGANADALSFVCAFAPQALPKNLPDAPATFAACRKQWPAFWRSGGAIDLSESRDPRWRELERRIVLSQYLMKVNEAGSLPPQESGLVIWPLPPGDGLVACRALGAVGPLAGAEPQPRPL